MAETLHHTSERKEPRCHIFETSAAPGDLLLPRPTELSQETKAQQLRKHTQKHEQNMMRMQKCKNSHLFVTAYCPKSTDHGNLSSRFSCCLQKTQEGPV